MFLVQVLKVMCECGESFEVFFLCQSCEYVEYFCQYLLVVEEQVCFEKMVSDFLVEQMELECDQDGDFDIFVVVYQVSIFGLISN